ALIDLFLAKRVKRGTLTVHHADGKTLTFGTPTAGFPDVTIRFTDAGAVGAILRDPGIGAGETYMNGRMTIDGEDARGLVRLLMQ
ncbi:hypothetical protein ABI017_14835, partial [Enterococcus faecium]|uniref:DUF7884 domain-containing protein n=1 Tax=Enterococcus faecium TaxID=1352 RepID=UPI003F43FBE0